LKFYLPARGPARATPLQQVLAGLNENYFVTKLLFYRDGFDWRKQDSVLILTARRLDGDAPQVAVIAYFYRGCAATAQKQSFRAGALAETSGARANRCLRSGTGRQGYPGSLSPRNTERGEPVRD
jgi:hypothetical protein